MKGVDHQIVDTTAPDAADRWYEALGLAVGARVLISTDAGTEIDDTLDAITFAKHADGSIWPYAVTTADGEVVLLPSIVYMRALPADA
jgi:hypothetical protein